MKNIKKISTLCLLALTITMSSCTPSTKSSVKAPDFKISAFVEIDNGTTKETHQGVDRRSDPILYGLNEHGKKSFQFAMTDGERGGPKKLHIQGGVTENEDSTYNAQLLFINLKDGAIALVASDTSSGTNTITDIQYYPIEATPGIGKVSFRYDFKNVKMKEPVSNTDYTVSGYFLCEPL